uniref:Release factor glutamine methyltransferase n=1 Tax=Candidatus Kentrum sp. LFY TaxID=2126342 RepID=A0A450VD61_9GAMM|nr:MAG: release factor glutamine methyltransferase [Candidatus Kentron sp. LFY]
MGKEQYAEFKSLEQQLVAEAKSRPGEDVEISGLTFRIPPSVFHAKIFDTNVDEVAALLPMKSGSSFMDIGCGCGVFAILAAKAGCSPVWASDINAEAVKATALNASRNDVDVTAVESDLFDDIPDNLKFDVIWFHHPYGQPEGYESLDDPFFVNLIDKDYRLLERYLRDAQKFLTPGTGRIYVVHGKEIGNRELMLQRVTEAKLNYHIVGTVEDGEDIAVGGVQLTTDLFELIPNPGVPGMSQS